MPILNDNTMKNFFSFLGSSMNISIFVLKYYDQWADHIDDYINEIDKDRWISIYVGPYCANCIEVVGTTGEKQKM